MDRKQEKTMLHALRYGAGAVKTSSIKFCSASKITSKLKAILASLRAFWVGLVHRITYAVNPFYRGLYSLYDLEQEYYSLLADILQRENSDDFYYSSQRYKADDRYRDKLFNAIEKLKERVQEIKKEGY